MLHTIWARLLLWLRALARSSGGALVRWSGAADAEPQASDDTMDDAGDNGQEAEQETQDTPEQRGRSTAELVTTAVSLLLICVLVGLILYDGYASGAAIPATVEVTVDVGAARQEGGLYYVPYEVHNAGDQTIEQVLVTFKVYDGAALIEETETVIALLGEHGDVSGMLVLDIDPAGLEIEARVSTFQAAGE